MNCLSTTSRYQYGLFFNVGFVAIVCHVDVDSIKIVIFTSTHFRQTCGYSAKLHKPACYSVFIANNVVTAPIVICFKDTYLLTTSLNLLLSSFSKLFCFFYLGCWAHAKGACDSLCPPWCIAFVFNFVVYYVFVLCKEINNTYIKI